MRVLLVVVLSGQWSQVVPASPLVAPAWCISAVPSLTGGSGQCTPTSLTLWAPTVRPVMWTDVVPDPLVLPLWSDAGATQDEEMLPGACGPEGSPSGPSLAAGPLGTTASWRLTRVCARCSFFTMRNLLEGVWRAALLMPWKGLIVLGSEFSTL